VRRLLWVTAVPPGFQGGGGEIRQAHLISAVADEFQVELLLAGTLNDKRLRELVRSVTEVPVGPALDAPGQLRRRLRDIRWRAIQRQSDEVARQRAIRLALGKRLAAIEEPDLVCVEYIGLAPLLPQRRRAMWALTLHNLPSGMARHAASVAPGARQRLMQALEERHARWIEEWATRSYDVVVTVSPDDAAVLPGKPVVVPNGVDTERFHPSPLPAEARVVFTGGLHTVANRDGIRWFCEEVWPHVRARVPNATLDVVGARPPAEVVALGDLQGVSVHSDVPDVVPYIERARVAVVPIRIGTGTRLKALEAMAAGRPVVATMVGLAGLGATDGREALIADDPPGFAEAVVRCLVHRETAAGLAERGRKLAEERFAWPRIGASYAALLQRRMTEHAATVRARGPN
jgi:polysaccharide biosynthesis protein PslH